MTEFSWDSSRPIRSRTRSAPRALGSEGCTACGAQGVSLVTWFRMRDEPFDRKIQFPSGPSPARTVIRPTRRKLALRPSASRSSRFTSRRSVQSVLGAVARRACGRCRRAAGPGWQPVGALRRIGTASSRAHFGCDTAQSGFLPGPSGEREGRGAPILSSVVAPGTRVVSGAPARPARSASHGRASADAAGLGFVLRRRKSSTDDYVRISSGDGLSA